VQFRQTLPNSDGVRHRQVAVSVQKLLGWAKDSVLTGPGRLWTPLVGVILAPVPQTRWPVRKLEELLRLNALG
jgi:hypothetical protein